MKQLWNILNSRLVAPIIVLILLALCIRFWPKPSLGDLLKETPSHRAETLPRIQLVDFREVPSGTNLCQKYVGVVRNNSRFIVSYIDASLCCYNSSNQLIEVLTRNLEGVGLLAAGKEADFSIELGERRAVDYGMTAEVKANTARVELKFIDLRVHEPKEDE